MVVFSCPMVARTATDFVLLGRMRAEKAEFPRVSVQASDDGKARLRVSRPAAGLTGEIKRVRYIASQSEVMGQMEGNFGLASIKEGWRQMPQGHSESYARYRDGSSRTCP